jgi:hypothetical protein
VGRSNHRTNMICFNLSATATIFPKLIFIIGDIMKTLTKTFFLSTVLFMGLSITSTDSVHAEEATFSPAIEFAVLGLTSLDKAFADAAALDGRIVEARDGLVSARTAIEALAGNDLPALQSKIKDLITSGALKVDISSGTPALSFDEALAPEAAELYATMEKLSSTISSMTVLAPELQESVTAVIASTQEAISNTPAEAKTAVKAKEIKMKQMKSIISGSKANGKELKNMPTHLTEFTSELTSSAKLLTDLVS